MNEGVDIPSVDTVLFLRPTESATLFLQQLGRGLRRSHGKAVLTALDFVGIQRAEFRFDTRFRALIGSSRRALTEAVDKDFPLLPAGSQILLDEVVQAQVVASLQRQLRVTMNDLVRELRNTPQSDLQHFLREQNLELSDVLRNNPTRTWTTLQRAVGRVVPPPGPQEPQLLRRVRALAHVDDPVRAQAYLRLLADPGDDAVPEALAAMLFFSLWPDGGGFDSIRAGLASLRHEPAVCAELAEVIRLGADEARNVPLPLTGDGLAGLPLSIHATYQREEIVAALGLASLTRLPGSFREGVARVERWNADAFFITLKKSEADFSPSTRYRDYALSPTLFHWESQSRTSVESPTGQRYLQHRALGGHILLFTRATTKHALGTAPYVFLGPASYVSHRGTRPIGITWRLHTPMPADAYLVARAVAS